MTPEKQRIAIAEACGWVGIDTAGFGLGWSGFNPSTPDWRLVPDYLNDLNAMHEAESYLNTEDGTLGNYHAELIHVMNCKNATWRRIHATAAQRAEAFLRTLNLWEEA